jgi:uncharacterized repeat protein (TIGR03803 family)
LKSRLLTFAFICGLCLLPAAAYTQTFVATHQLSFAEASFPESGLVKSADHHLYGTANGGGLGSSGPFDPRDETTWGYGSIFRVDAGGAITVVKFLQPADGIRPVGLMRGRDNFLYGVNEAGGGPQNAGTIFRLNQNGSGYQVLHVFDCSHGTPFGAPTEGPDGALYGVTNPFPDRTPDCQYGGVYRLDKVTLALTWVATFDAGVTGADMFGSPVITADGSIYGTTQSASNPLLVRGTVFKVNPGGGLVDPPLHVFTGPDGSHPAAGLVRGADGTMYGTTQAGGAFDGGTIFSITEDGTFALLFSFQPGSGRLFNPAYSQMFPGPDGKLYGIVEGGGANDAGGVFQFDTTLPALGITVIRDFDALSPLGNGVSNNDGAYSIGPLSLGAADRHLYGSNSEGGTTTDGTLFGLPQVTIANRPPFAAVTATPSTVVQVGATPPDVTLNALGSYDPDFDGLIYTWHLDGGTLASTTQDGLIHATFPAGLHHVTVDVTDDGSSGGSLTSSASVLVTVVDQPPVLTVPANITVTATSASGKVVTFTVTATDLVDPAPPVSCDAASGATFAIGATTVKCTATDNGGNLTTKTFVVRVTDTPIVTAMSNLTVSATNASGAIVTFATPTASNLAGNVPVTCSPGSGTQFQLGTTTVQCTATGAHDITTQTFQVTVVDQTPPVVTVPGPINAPADLSGHAVVAFTVSALDNVDGAKTPVCRLPSNAIVSSGATFSLGTTHVTCTAVDLAGNSGSAGFDVIVASGVPALSVPGNMTVEATSHSGATVTFAATASDANGPIPVTCDHASGSNFSLGTTTVHCSATGAGGSTSGSFTVMVVDTKGPVITFGAGGFEASATSPAGVQIFYQGPNNNVLVPLHATPVATDAVDGDRPVTCTPANGYVFPVGYTNLVCTASDSTGHTSTTTFLAAVYDADFPVIHVPAPVVEATGPHGQTVPFSVTVTDVSDQAHVTLSCDHTSSFVYQIGTTLVTCTAEDFSHNKTTATFNVVVRDTTPPTPPVLHAISVTAPGSVAVTFSVGNATDVVDGSVAPSCDRASGSLFVIGTTTVHCSFTDSHGNTATASFDVTVILKANDKVPPVVTVPSALTVEATKPGGAVVTFTASAYDAVDGTRPVTCTPASGSTFALGITTVVCKAKDVAGNEGSASFKITVKDTTPPAITVPSPIVVASTSYGGAKVTFTATATDLVDGSRPVTCTPGSGTTFPISTTTVTCKSTDKAGNTGEKKFTVTVVKPPTLTVKLSPGLLWPPNHKMVTIAATITATNGSGPAPTVTLVSITSNEPDNGLGDGDTANDIQGASFGTNDRSFQLRAERAGRGPGRVYTVTYKVVNPAYPTIFTTVVGTVIVPHDIDGDDGRGKGGKDRDDRDDRDRDDCHEGHDHGGDHDHDDYHDHD